MFILKTAYSFPFHLTWVLQHHVSLEITCITVELLQKQLGNGRGKQGKAFWKQYNCTSGKQYKIAQMTLKKKNIGGKSEMKWNAIQKEGKSRVGIFSLFFHPSWEGGIETHALQPKYIIIKGLLTPTLYLKQCNLRNIQASRLKPWDHNRSFL